MTLKPCIECGEPTPRTYCPDCQPPDTRNHRRDLVTSTWIRLSRRARKLQPFCTLCGSTERLEADHHPRAWARTAAKKPLRPCDITVLCQACNRNAGSSKPGSDRYQHWQQTDNNPHADTPDTSLTNQGGHPPKRGHQPRGVAKFPSHTPGGIHD